MFMHIKGTYHS